MSKLLERISSIKSSIESEKCLKICWLIQALPMAFVSITLSWFIIYLLFSGLDLINLDFVIIFAMWIMGCSFCVQAAKFPRLWFEDWVMLANTVYESIVCSAAILRFSPKISEREDGIWIIGVMVITTVSVYVLTMRSYLVWRNDTNATKTNQEEDVGMIVL